MTEGGNGADRNADGSVEQMTASNLDKVRDILFGSEVRRNEQRFVRFEEKLAKELAAIRADSKKRFDALEERLSTEIDALNKSLRAEQQERESGDKDLARQVADLGKNLDKRLGALDAQTGKSMRELHQHAIDQAKLARSEAKKGLDEVSAALEAARHQLQGGKLERATLASLLHELASQIEKEKSSAK